jgi:hypothetical protein
MDERNIKFHFLAQVDQKRYNLLNLCESKAIFKQIGHMESTTDDWIWLAEGSTLTQV